MPRSSPPRVAVLGFSIECNKFAPPARRADFLYLQGEALLAEARATAPRMLPETPGCVAAMDGGAPWAPVGIALAMAGPNGPVEHGVFAELIGDIEHRLRAALPVDAVYICAHGAGLTTEEDDPDGLVFERVRAIVGPDVPIAATLDLHANVSARMVRSLDAFIGYCTNPHLDMRERGIEAAAAIREMLAGMRPKSIMIRLPIVPPTVTMLTAAGPYAEMIALGQQRMSPEILNVSVMGGFAFADTADNGLAIVVTARRDRQAAMALAGEIAELGWVNRARFYPQLTPLDEAVAKALAVGRDPALPALAFADVADNPGGGGRGASFDARFNRAETTKFSKPWAAPATVVALTDGDCLGRRGIYAGMRLRLGPCAALQVGGVTVVVVSNRVQCADPVFFEMMGLDVGAARSVAVKSRGHFRGGFDEFCGPDRIVEVDLPGLTSPMLGRFDYKKLPRPVVPLDDNVEWRRPRPKRGHPRHRA
ncbi:MAG TPA: M81 family metallopeptidase [Stellaceae bacterium]